MDDTSSEIDYQRRFGGIGRLFGDVGLRRLRRAHVCVIGVGGVGSWAAEALVRSGVEALTLVDMDHVAESNINRQLAALDDTLGKAKVQVLAERAALINRRCRVSTVEDFVTVNNLGELVDARFSWVIDCIDNARTKEAIVAHCYNGGIPVVTVGGAGGRADATRIRVSDLARTEQDPLLARVRRELRRNYGFSSDPKRRFDVPSVWSDEPVKIPDRACAAPVSGLNCAGFGAIMPVTAGFGMVASGFVLSRLVAYDD